MAKKGKDETAQAEACPTFTLWADRPGHLRALLAIARDVSVPQTVAQEIARPVREFELWLEAHK